MDIMLEKLNAHPKGKEIIAEAYKVVEDIKNNKKFDDSEKLLLVDLIYTKMSYDMFKREEKSK